MKIIVDRVNYLSYNAHIGNKGEGWTAMDRRITTVLGKMHRIAQKGSIFKEVYARKGAFYAVNPYIAIRFKCAGYEDCGKNAYESVCFSEQGKLELDECDIRLIKEELSETFIFDSAFNHGTCRNAQTVNADYVMQALSVFKTLGLATSMSFDKEKLHMSASNAQFSIDVIVMCIVKR